MRASRLVFAVTGALVTALLAQQASWSFAGEDAIPAAASSAPQLSPEERMKSRHPQPILAGDLIGLPVLDDDDSTIGYIDQVVRSPEGKVQLIVPYRPQFGWLRNGGVFDWGRRPVAVPIEVVAILARQVAALDMPRQEFDASPTFTRTSAAIIPPDEKILIGITRR